MPPKIVYFTIDDAPSKDMKYKVDHLVSLKIPAIWYCRGEYMEEHFDHVVYAIKKGFWIGNHSYTHPYFSKLSLKKCQEEIHKTELLIEKAYKLANEKRMTKIFRFPFGDRGEGEKARDLQKFLKDEGFKRVNFAGITYPYYQNYAEGIDAMWTFDSIDYALMSKNGKKKYGIGSLEDLLLRIDKVDPENGLGLNTPGSNEIVLIHDFEELTFAFEPFIQKLMDKKLKFAMPIL